MQNLTFGIYADSTALHEQIFISKLQHSRRRWASQPHMSPWCSDVTCGRLKDKGGADTLTTSMQKLATQKTVQTVVGGLGGVEFFPVMIHGLSLMNILS